MRALVKKFWLASSATAAIEFAFIVPLMLVLFAGVIEVGRAYQVYNATNRLATQYAIAWADCSDSPVGTCNSELGYFNSASSIANIAPQLHANLLSLTMFQVTMSGSTPNVIYASPSGATPSASQNSAAAAVLTNGQSGIIVTATYNHTLAFFQTLMSPALSSYLTASFTAVQLKG
jgi:Flp pilus assembly protein TadG